MIHENFSCIIHRPALWFTVHESHCQPKSKYIKKKKKEKNQRRAHMHEHNCAWSTLSGRSSLGCGVTNRMLSSVFPAGCLTVMLFPSWANMGSSYSLLSWVWDPRREMEMCTFSMQQWISNCWCSLQRPMHFQLVDAECLTDSPSLIKELIKQKLRL